MSSFVNMKETPKSPQVIEREKDLEEFIAKYNLRMNKKRRRQLIEQSSFEQYESYKIGLEVSFCCKDTNLDRAKAVYHRAKELNIRLPPHGYNNLLCLTAGLGEPGHGCQMQRYAESPYDIELATMIFEDMKEHSLTPTEAGYSALIRCYCQSLNPLYASKAIDIYEDLKSKGIHPKQRTFTALLQYYATTQPNQQKCFELFEEMQSLYEIVPTEKEYVSLLRVCLLSQDAKMFYDTLSKMMEDLLLLYSEETLQVIKQWFESSAATTIPSTNSSSSTVFQCEESLIENSEGIVQVNGEKLKSIDLDEETKQGLLEKLRSIAIHRDPNHKYKPNNKVRELVAAKQLQQELDVNSPSTGNVNEGSDEAVAAVVEEETTATTVAPTVVVVDPDRLSKWEDFERTLTENVYDIIIDGANVGYYNQNYQGAPTHVDYLQIHQMVEVIVKQYKKKPLLILHSRHIADHVTRQVPAYTYDSLDMTTVTAGGSGTAGTPHVKTIRITVKEMIQSWQQDKVLYATPKSFNDDWFWMFATLKYNIPVITNDEMRDHHFQLLSPRYFIRWRERHRVRYNFFYKYPALLRRLLFGSGFVSHEQYDHSDNDSDSDSESEGENEEEGERVDAIATSVSSSTTTGLSRQLVNYNPAYRKVNLKWPLTYSYRMQEIHSDRYEGFYFPPVVHQKSYHAPLLTTKVVNSEQVLEQDDDDDKQPCAPKSSSSNVTDANHSKAIVDADVSTAELIENIVIDDKERLKLPWTCFYRPKASVTNEPNGKRQREEEDSIVGSSADDSMLPTPIKLRRQITKSALCEEF